MKVYKIECQGETDHIAFDGGILEAIRFYVEETMCESEDVESISIFPQEKWKDVTIKYDEDNLEMTIAEYMKGHTWNEVICSTSYLQRYFAKKNRRKMKQQLLEDFIDYLRDKEDVFYAFDNTEEVVKEFLKQIK